MNDLHGIVFAYRESPDLRELAQVRNSCSIPVIIPIKIITVIRR